MKRLLLFLGFSAVGTAILVLIAGGLANPTKREREGGELPVSDKAPGARPSLETPDGQLDIERASNITQMAPPTRIVWKDRLSDETITIDNFQPWRCTAREIHPLPVPATGGQGARLEEVVIELFREPESRAEALALRDGTGDARYDTLLHQRFQAGHARVTGKLGEAMAARRNGGTADASLGDSAIELSQDIVLVDKGQGIVIRGGERAVLTVYPERGHAKGKGQFALDHDAVRMTGTGLVLDRNRERGYIRVEVKENPRLRIEKADAAGGDATMFDFGGGDFEPTTVTSSGRAVLEREMMRRETVLTVMFHDQVYAAQVSGRTLEAGRATLVAYRPTTPAATSDGWKLRRFHADRHVTIHYPGRTKDDEPYLATIDASRLRYDVPEDGREPTTVLEEDVEIRMRGEIAVLGPDGMLRATCRDRAWIGPLPPEAPDGGVARELLRQIALRGDAVLARTTMAAVGREESIRADAIDLVVWPQERAGQDGKPAPDTGTPESRRMTAIHFAAVGAVHLAGAQVEGDTERVVADDLHTTAPRVFAEGEGTRFSFRRIARDQGLLGPATDGTAGDGSGQGADAAPGAPEGRWMLQHVVARGAVDIDTTLGGPALGIPASLQGDEITYDGLSRIARVRAEGGEPVRIGWSASGTRTNHVATRTLTLDRAAGRLTAEGGVEGELYVSRDGARPGLAMPGTARRRLGPALDSAELTVRTDNRIDLTLARLEGSVRPTPGAQQWIRIAGPVTTELRTSSRTVDRMRSESLDVALAWQMPDERPTGMTTVPAARAEGPRSTGAAEPLREQPAPALERIDVQAGNVRVDLDAGEPRYMVAEGGVDLRSRDGHVTGARLTYDGARRRIEVHADARAPARALLGSSNERSEVQAERMIVDVQGGRVSRLEAHAPAGRTSDIHIYRSQPDKPGTLEWFDLTYQGNIVMTDARLLTQRVRLVRRVRKAGETTFGDPMVLRAPRLMVTGTRMLATQESERDVQTIEALESGTGPGSEVNLVYGKDAERTELWGHRLVVFVPRQRARLEGRPGRDLRIRQGGRLTMDKQEIELDLTTNLPTLLRGSRVHWKPGR